MCIPCAETLHVWKRPQRTLFPDHSAGACKTKESKCPLCSDLGITIEPPFGGTGVLPLGEKVPERRQGLPCRFWIGVDRFFPGVIPRPIPRIRRGGPLSPLVWTEESASSGTQGSQLAAEPPVRRVARSPKCGVSFSAISSASREGVNWPRRRVRGAVSLRGLACLRPFWAPRSQKRVSPASRPRKSNFRGTRLGSWAEAAPFP